MPGLAAEGEFPSPVQDSYKNLKIKILNGQKAFPIDNMLWLLSKALGDVKF